MRRKKVLLVILCLLVAVHVGVGFVPASARRLARRQARRLIGNSWKAAPMPSTPHGFPNWHVLFKPINDGDPGELEVAGAVRVEGPFKTDVLVKIRLHLTDSGGQRFDVDGSEVQIPANLVSKDIYFAKSLEMPAGSYVGTCETLSYAMKDGKPTDRSMGSGLRDIQVNVP